MIRSILVSVGATILGIALVQVANGFMGTFVAMSTAAAGFSPAGIGIVLAAYYAGYTLGAATVAPILQRVGHIRLFAALAGLVAASISLQPVFTSAPAWIVIRLVTGFGCAGLFITAESWLNASSTPSNRGAIFAVYMVAIGAAFGGGQFLLNLAPPGSFELFAAAAALFGISLVPVALTRSAAPKLVESPRLKLGELRRLAPVAFAGCIATGLISSVFYGLVPAYAQTQGLPAREISALMATAIFGGLLFQVPVGKLSDLFDRRLVAAAIAGGLIVTAVIIALLPLNETLTLVLMFLFGGFMFTVYPVCVAHANDRVEPERVVSVSGQLILIHGIASFAGPILGTAVMGRAGIAGVYLYMAAVAFLFLVTALWRAAKVDAPVHKDRPFVILTERMGQPLAHVADEQAIVGGPDDGSNDAEQGLTPDPLDDAVAADLATERA